jgi:chorismate mutase
MDKSEALKLLQNSRNKIDQIDDEIINLIQKRTSLAKDVATAKMVLDKNVEDKEREDYIQHKIREIAREKNIDAVSLQKIIKILTDLSKVEQEKILRR